jgi:GntR family transcriptional repressor for pyruvate dehydrogenase complex
MTTGRQRTSSSGGRKLGFGKLEVPKGSDVLAARIRKQILDGELQVGAALPPERVIAEESGLSRTVVREALRVLESEDLVSTRPGRKGGSIVRQPDAGSFARSVDMFIRGRRVRFDAVLEARSEIEPICARMAAERHTAADLDELDLVNARMDEVIDDRDAFLAANVTWHVTVARMSHNELLGGFMQALSAAVRATTDIEHLTSPEIRRATAQAHAGIVDAIRSGDGARAFALMKRHIEAYRGEILKRSVPDEIALDGNDAAH